MRKIEADERMYISFLRGAAVFLMVWGHCIQYCSNLGYEAFCNNIVTKFIYSMHMPLFMLISGYLFYFSAERRNFHDLMVHKIQTLIQPLIFCTIFRWVCEKIYNIIIGEASVQSILSSDYTKGFFSLWFIFSALLCVVWVGFVHKKIKNKIIRFLLLIAGFGFIMFFPNRDMNIFMYPYFVIGFIYSKYRNNKVFGKLIDMLKYICLPLFPVMLSFYDYKHYIYNTGVFAFYDDDDYTIIDSIKIDIFRYLIGLAGSVFVIIVLKWIFKLIYSKNNTLINPVVKIGNMSLQFYCISTILQNVIPKLIFTKLGLIDFISSNQLLYSAVYCLAFGFLWTVLSYFVIKLIYKLKIGNILFGR